MAHDTGLDARTDRSEHALVFLALVVLTGLELTVAKVPGVGHRALVSALVVLAVSKAALIGLFFMHLKYETRSLKLTVLLPLLAPALYAVALIADATWRLL